MKEKLTLSSYVVSYFFTSVVFFGIDLLWLGVVAKPLYDKYIGELMRENVKWVPALVFYFSFIVGLFIFAIVPAFQAGSLRKAAVLGGLFGFFSYATYELTNYAVIDKWPFGIVIIDILWGIVISSVTATAGYLIISKV